MFLCSFVCRKLAKMEKRSKMQLRICCSSGHSSAFELCGNWPFTVHTALVSWKCHHHHHHHHLHHHCRHHQRHNFIIVIIIIIVLSPRPFTRFCAFFLKCTEFQEITSSCNFIVRTVLVIPFLKARSNPVLEWLTLCPKFLGQYCSLIMTIIVLYDISVTLISVIWMHSSWRCSSSKTRSPPIHDP